MFSNTVFPCYLDKKKSEVKMQYVNSGSSLLENAPQHRNIGNKFKKYEKAKAKSVTCAC